jgi:two-component sensor histidine kinase
LWERSASSTASRTPSRKVQIAQLKALASIVMDQMELRLSARRAIAYLARMVDEKEAALRRAELMAKEIDHRVMNSLQLVSGLLNVQSRGMGSSEAAEQLELASHRVTAISQVHHHIYQSDGVDKVNCKGYLERLCAEPSSTLRSAESDAIAVVSDDVKLPARIDRQRAGYEFRQAGGQPD